MTLDPPDPGMLLAGAAVLTGVVRVVVSLADTRARAGGWPVRGCGRAAAGLLLHDLVVGAAAFAVFVLLPVELAGRWAGESARPWVLAAGLAASLLLTPSLLDRRRGAALVPGPRRRRLAAEPRPSRRELLLQAVERRSVRAVSSWLSVQVDRCRRRCAATAELLLPALWPPARQVLRETAGVSRTELTLLLQQAQAVVDDAAPAQERILTLLQLVHDRAGRGGVRRVLRQARRAPLRHGRAGASIWGLGGAASAAPRLTIDLTGEQRPAVPKPAEAADDAPASTAPAASATGADGAEGDQVSGRRAAASR